MPAHRLSHLLPCAPSTPRPCPLPPCPAPTSPPADPAWAAQLAAEYTPFVLDMADNVDDRIRWVFMGPNDEKQVGVGGERLLCSGRPLWWAAGRGSAAAGAADALVSRSFAQLQACPACRTDPILPSAFHARLHCGAAGGAASACPQDNVHEPNLSSHAADTDRQPLLRVSAQASVGDLALQTLHCTAWWQFLVQVLFLWLPASAVSPVPPVLLSLPACLPAGSTT